MPFFDLLFSTTVDPASSGPPPTIQASITSDYVFLNNFTPSANVVVNAGGPPVTVTTDANGNATINAPQLGDIVPGTTIRVTDGFFTKSFTVEDVSITNVNTASNTAAAGAAEPSGAVVRQRRPGPPACERPDDVERRRDWGWQFSVDITGGTSVVADVISTGGDRSRADVHFPLPFVHASITNGSIELFRFTPNHNVHVTIRNPYTTFAIDTMADSTGHAFLQKSDTNMDLNPAMQITADDGTTLKVLDLADVSLHMAVGLNHVDGAIHSPYSQLEVALYKNGSELARVAPSVASSGDFSAELPFTVQAGTYGRVDAIDADQDRTRAEANIPLPNIQASTTNDWISLGQWAPASVVTVKFTPPPINGASVTPSTQLFTVDSGGNLFVPRSTHGIDIVPEWSSRPRAAERRRR